MEKKKHILDYLNNHGIDFEVFDHPPLFTVDQAKDRDDKIPWTHTKNIFIRDKKKNYYLITLCAHKKLDTKIFKLQAGITDFSFATPEQLLEQLNLTPGSVWIFWLLYNPNIKLFIDQDIWSSEQIGRHPNENTATLVTSHDWFKKYLDSLRIDYKVVIL